MFHSKPSLLALGAVLVILQLSSKTVYGSDSKNKCLTDLQISTNKSSTSLQVDWSYGCKDVKEFKIYWKQTRYLACDQDIEEHQQKQNTETTQDNVIVLEGLLPYSQYSVEVKAIKNKRSRGTRPEKLDVTGTTLGALPEVRLKKDTRAINSDFATKTSVRFYWSAPTDCTGYNGELGGYFYKLIGDQTNRSEFLTLDQTHVDISDLEPFQNYNLKVYVTDVNNEKSENYLSLSQTTLPTKPPAPTDLTASINYDKYIVTWKAPDPPRGELDYYVLRWKEEPSLDWMSVKLPQTTSCPETSSQCTYTTDTLDTTSNITFQITAYNKGVTDSDSSDQAWSQAFTNTGDSAGQNWSNGKITIIALVSVVFLLLLVIVLIVVNWKCRRNNSFEGILQYDPDKPSPFDRDDHTRDTTRTTRTELSDYSLGVPTIIENGTKTEPYKIVDIVFPDQNTHRRSTQDPLPLRPGEEEPIYYEPQLVDKDKDGEEVYLAPRVASVESLDDDGYLRPNYKPPKDDMEQSEEEYLKPNFNRLPRIDTLDRSPDRDFRPIIPITSYGSKDGLALDDNTNTKIPRVLQSAV